MIRVRPLTAVATLLFSATGISAQLTVPTGARWFSTGGSTTIEFNHHMLADLGIELHGIERTARSSRPGAAGFAVTGWPGMSFVAFGRDLEAFESGSLHHRGGFFLTIRDELVSFSPFQLYVSGRPLDLALVDAEGRRWFRLEYGHAYLYPETGRMLLQHLDIVIADEMAAFLGRSDLAGTFIGTADVDLSVSVPPGAAEGAGDCDAPFTGTTDIAMVEMSGVSQIVRSGGRVALAPNAKLENVGTAAVPWYRPIFPDGGGNPAIVGDHPILTMAVYRLANGTLEQIGLSEIKHVFFAQNADCNCPGSQILYPGCTDLYAASTNASQGNLAPRAEISAGAVTYGDMWTRLGSHFDGTPVDDERDHESGDHSALDHRLSVAEADLMDAAAKYYVEGWYVAPDDVDIFNSMGHRQVVPTFGGSIWTFPFAAAPAGNLMTGSILDRWVNPSAPGPGAASTLLAADGDELQLAMRSVALTPDVYRYDYALMNFDFDRQIDEFSVPLPPGTVVASIRFHDPDTDASNDWAGSEGGGALTWQAPAGNGLDWGMLFNFSFIADATPDSGIATLGILEPGTGSTLNAASQVPDSVTGAPILGTSGSCPGSVTVSIDNATPGGQVVLAWSSSLGSATVPGGPCAGTSLGLANPKVAKTFTAPGSGSGDLVRTLGGAACGIYLQALDVSTCTPTNVGDLP